jgi:hypothetical protein
MLIDASRIANEILMFAAIARATLLGACARA